MRWDLDNFVSPVLALIVTVGGVVGDVVDVCSIDNESFRDVVSSRGDVICDAANDDDMDKVLDGVGSMRALTALRFLSLRIRDATNCSGD